VAGRVSQVLASEGQAVVAGEPIAIIEEDGVQEVLAWFHEGQELPHAMRVRITDPYTGKVAESV
jgi:pyruvate/2-oxoglutarate dehydrogenase complex dihydrolipoamide acyltransferase (E2) component